MAEPDITQSIPKAAENGLSCNQKPLKPRHLLFVNEYIVTKNASEAARRAGFSVKTAGAMGGKMLKKPHIRAAIDEIERKELESSAERAVNAVKDRSKDSIINGALNDYESLPVESPVRPRYLDLAMKGLGIIGSGANDKPNQTLIINVDAKALPQGERWDRLRQLIDGS